MMSRSKPMRVPVQVLVHPVRRTETGWEYLMLRRIPSRGRFWQGVTGAPEWGETLAEGGRRELLEETGLLPIELIALDLSYTYPMMERWLPLYADDVKEIVEHVFVATVDGSDPTLDPIEHDAFRWCRFEEALSLVAFQENREALECCQAFLLSDDAR